MSTYNTDFYPPSDKYSYCFGFTICFHAVECHIGTLYANGQSLAFAWGTLRKSASLFSTVTSCLKVTNISESALQFDYWMMEIYRQLVTHRCTCRRPLNSVYMCLCVCSYGLSVTANAVGYSVDCKRWCEHGCIWYLKCLI